MVSRLGACRRGGAATRRRRPELACPALVPGCFVAWVYRTSSITPAAPPAPHRPGYIIIYPSADSVISRPPGGNSTMQDPGQFAHPPQPVTGDRNTPAGKRSDPADCLPLLVVPVSRSMIVTGKTLYGRVSRPPVNYHRPTGRAGSPSSPHKTSTMRLRSLPLRGLSLARAATGASALPTVDLTHGCALRGVWPHMPQGPFCPVIGYVGGGDIPCVERADQHAGEDVRVC